MNNSSASAFAQCGAPKYLLEQKKFLNFQESDSSNISCAKILVENIQSYIMIKTYVRVDKVG